MKTTLKLFIFLVSFALMTSCITLNNGNFSNSGILMSKGFDYVKSNVTGSSSTKYVLFLFGGSSKDALIADAKSDLSKKHPLMSNQAYVNTTISIKNTIVLFGVFIDVTCVVSADIVEFVDPSVSNKTYPVVNSTVEKEELNKTDQKVNTINSSISNVLPEIEKNTSKTEPEIKVNFKPGDKVVFVAKHFIKGVEKDVQITNGKVTSIVGDKLYITYFYNYSKYSIVKNYLDVKKKDN